MEQIQISEGLGEFLPQQAPEAAIVLHLVMDVQHLSKVENISNVEPILTIKMKHETCGKKFEAIVSG